MASPRQTARSRAILVPTHTRYRREDVAKLRINFVKQKKKGGKFVESVGRVPTAKE